MIRRALSCQAAVLLGMAALLLVAYAGLAVDAAQHHLMPLDEGLRSWVLPLRSSVLDGPMRTVSWLGEPAGLTALILIGSAALWRPSRRWALLLPPVMAGTGALQYLGKWAAARPRPNEAPWGFPSGHVLSLAVYLGIVAFVLVTLSDRRRRFRVLSCFACGALLGAVAVSRIYLDMHWLSDVLGGFTLGTAYLLVAIWVGHRLPVPRPALAPEEIPQTALDSGGSRV
ncbi:MAG TPA: phosphatase PAP2 family protein [Methylomirabilota bacterium]|nr:phosphatase PAP2 family protein [Methylomirabilota bacterium]